MSFLNKNKYVKRFLFIIAGVTAVILLIVSYAILSLEFMPKPKLQQIVSSFITKSLHRETTISDSVVIKYFPLRVAFRGLKINNLEGFSTPYLIEVKDFKIYPKWTNLLLGEVVFNKIRFLDGNFNLERRSDGAENWVLHPENLQEADTAQSLASSFSSFITDLPSELYLENIIINFIDKSPKAKYKTLKFGISSLEYDMEDIRNAALSIVGEYDNQPFSFEYDGARPDYYYQDFVRHTPLTAKLKYAGNTLEMQGKIGSLSKDPLSDVSMDFIWIGGKLSSLNPVFQTKFNDAGPYQLSFLLNSDPEKAQLKVENFAAYIAGVKMSGQGALSIPSLLDTDLIDYKAVIDIDPFVFEDFKNKVWPNFESLPASQSKIQGNSQVRVSDVQIGGYHVKDFSMNVHQKDQAYMSKDIKASLFNGSMSGEMSLTPNQMQAKLTLSRANLKQIFDQEEIRAPLDMTFELTTQGKTQQEFVNNMTGELLIKTTDGAIKRDFLNSMSADLFSMFTPEGEKSQRKEASLRCFVGDFKLRGPYLRSRFLLVETPYLTIVGAGSYDFTKSQMDVTLIPHHKNPSLFRLTSPFELTGDIQNPKVNILSANLVGRAVGGVLLGLVNPFAAIGSFIDFGMSDDEICQKAMSGEYHKVDLFDEMKQYKKKRESQ